MHRASVNPGASEEGLEKGRAIFRNVTDDRVIELNSMLIEAMKRTAECHEGQGWFYTVEIVTHGTKPIGLGFGIDLPTPFHSCCEKLLVHPAPVRSWRYQRRPVPGLRTQRRRHIPTWILQWLMLSSGPSEQDFETTIHVTLPVVTSIASIPSWLLSHLPGQAVRGVCFQPWERDILSHNLHA